MPAPVVFTPTLALPLRGRGFLFGVVLGCILGYWVRGGEGWGPRHSSFDKLRMNDGGKGGRPHPNPPPPGEGIFFVGGIFVL